MGAKGMSWLMAQAFSSAAGRGAAREGILEKLDAVGDLRQCTLPLGGGQPQSAGTAR